MQQTNEYMKSKSVIKRKKSYSCLTTRKLADEVKEEAEKLEIEQALLPQQKVNTVTIPGLSKKKTKKIIKKLVKA